MEEQAKLSFFKKWWISARPFSFPASTMPVIFGTVLAYVYGGHEFKPLLFILAFIGMVILHSGANILSDIFDFEKGLDKVPAPTSGGVVRGIITIREAWIGSVTMLIAGTAIGLYLTWVSGPWLLAIGLLGLLVGTFYTSHTMVNMKYNGLGDLAVFLNFGILGSLGAYYVQSGVLSWIPVIWRCLCRCWSLPSFMQITGAIFNPIRRSRFLPLLHYWEIKTHCVITAF